MTVTVKFDKLYRRAKELCYDYVATGHYARIERNENGRYLLKKAVDMQKDQSYVLYSLTQEQLAHTLFPLGEMTKSRVREIAEERGFVNARKHDSQDICFVQNGDYADFIEKRTGKCCRDGDFVDRNGKVIGRHRGIIHYTVGQRKGLGISYDEPLYVCAIDKEKNTVTLGKESELYSRILTAKDINLISVPYIDRPCRLKAKVRYRGEEKWATVKCTGNDTIRVEFDEPQRAVTKGQSVVLYDGDTVCGRRND